MRGTEVCASLINRRLFAGTSPQNPIAISSTPKCANDGRARGQIPLERENNPATPPSRAMTQPISRRLRQGTSEIDPADGGHDQVAENQQHAGDANEAGHDEAKQRVKRKSHQRTRKPVS